MRTSRTLPVPDVTVVIPTHNRLGYLRQALASVSAQSRPVAEVIVVDDGSTDGTSDWLGGTGTGGWTADFGVARLRCVRQTPGRGGSAARNAGLARCETPFVLFLDDDDLLRPEAVGTLGAALAAHPQAAAAAGRYRRFGHMTEAARDLQPRFRLTVPVWREELFGWNMPPAAVLWRTDVVRSIGGWDTSLPRCEDRDLNLRAYPRPFVLVPETVMDYRVHAGQLPGSAQVEIDRLVLTRFVQSLTSRDRRVGQAILDAHRHLERGLARYISGDFRAAVPELITMLRIAPSLYLSPILSPWLIGLIAKSAVGAAMPRRVATAAQAVARRRRPSAPDSPEQDSIA